MITDERSVAVALVVVALAAGCGGEGDGSGNPPPAPPASPAAPTEERAESPRTPAEQAAYDLATIDAGREISPEDRRVRRYGRLLGALSRKCRQGPTNIADMSVVAWKRLDDDRWTNFKLLRELNRSIGSEQLNASGGRVDCAEQLSVLVVLGGG